MEFVFILLLFFVFVPIMCHYESSKRKKKNEKISEAVDKYLSGISNTFSDITYTLTVPSEQKKIDRANIDWENFKLSIFLTGYENGKTAEEIVQEHLEYSWNEKAKNAIKILNLSQSEVISTCVNLYYCGKILKKDEKHQNSSYLNEILYNNDESLRISLQQLLIPKNEWVLYGSRVLHMHNLIGRGYYDLFIRDE